MIGFDSIETLKLFFEERHHKQNQKTRSRPEEAMCHMWNREYLLSIIHKRFCKLMRQATQLFKSNL